MTENLDSKIGLPGIATLGNLINLTVPRVSHL